jgi:ribosomal-protein-alanine N-acetyltransferase
MADFVIRGPALALRLPRSDDAPTLFGLASDDEVTRFFSWGPYRTRDEPARYLDRLAAQRERGEHLDLAIVRGDGDGDGDGELIGITGLSEVSRRDRRAVVGSWLGRAWWGTGANAEAKALVAHLAFALLGFERLGAYTAVDHARSQAALAGLGFAREGVLRRFHRHGARVHDVVSWSLLREEWARSPLAAVEVRVQGAPPPAFSSAGSPS